jgi:hypothetical protein
MKVKHVRGGIDMSGDFSKEEFLDELRKYWDDFFADCETGNDVDIDDFFEELEDGLKNRRINKQ